MKGEKTFGAVRLVALEDLPCAEPQALEGLYQDLGAAIMKGTRQKNFRVEVGTLNVTNDYHPNFRRYKQTATVTPITCCEDCLFWARSINNEGTGFCEFMLGKITAADFFCKAGTPRSHAEEDNNEVR